MKKRRFPEGLPHLKVLPARRGSCNHGLRLTEIQGVLGPAFAGRQRRGRDDDRDKGGGVAPGPPRPAAAPTRPIANARCAGVRLTSRNVRRVLAAADPTLLRWSFGILPLNRSHDLPLSERAQGRHCAAHNQP